MSDVINYDEDAMAVCPFTERGICVTECMMMRYTGFGEPSCSFKVMADELVLLSTNLREIRKMQGGDER